ncbi:glutaredoxin [Armillaria luteobubalina]|uniref:glutathione peroxidase n=1 Tax=Armillaria luteobubalina TaxID=153913 RepID=A0AA39Q2T6_9AGAR|nr:glutaredoxin [Armillaria luteobubalina]
MLSRLSAISRYFTSSAATQNSSNMSVKNFVEDTITSHKITVFSKSYCPYCRRAKTLFSDKYPDADIGVIELDERDDGSDIQDYLRQKTGQGTVPNIFIDQQHIGGCDDTMSLQNTGKLAGLIAA